VASNKDKELRAAKKEIQNLRSRLAAGPDSSSRVNSNDNYADGYDAQASQHHQSPRRSPAAKSRSSAQHKSDWNFDTEMNDPYAADGAWDNPAPVPAPAPAPSRGGNSRRGNGGPKAAQQRQRGSPRQQSQSSQQYGQVSGVADWEDVPIQKGNANAQIEAEASAAAAATTQCPTCGRTFNDKAFAKHRG